MNNSAERITEHTYRLPLGDGGEVWGRRIGLNSHDETSMQSFGTRASKILGSPVEGFSDNQIAHALAASFDINRPLLGEVREQFLGRLTEWAQQEKLPSPFLQPVIRSIKLDWPGLSENDIPRVMMQIADILGH